MHNKKHLQHSELGLLDLDPDTLDLGVIAQSLGTHLTANSGLLEATERRILLEIVVSVDPDRAGLESVGHVDGLIEICGVDTGSQAVLGVVGLLHELIDRLEGQDNGDGAEDLLPGQLGVLGHVVEHGGLDKEALCADSAAPGQALETGLLGDVQVVQDGLELVGRGLCALVNALLEGISDLQVLNGGLELAEEVPVPLFVGGLDVDPASGAAHLTAVEEDARDQVLDGFLDVAVLENDVW